MSSLNKIQIIGNLGREPEIRHTQDGKTVANLTVACSERWKGKDGSQQDKTEWVNVVVFGKLADVIEKYLKKGSKVYFEGKLQTRKYTDKDGVERYITEVNANNMIMLDSKGGNTQQTSNNVESNEPDFDDDIPFN